MQISEPLTLITDYLMALLALYWGLRLGRGGVGKDWRLAFLLISFVAWVGGTYHGLRLNFPELVSNALWRLTLVGAVVSSLFFLKAGLGQFDRVPLRAGWVYLIYLKAFVALVVCLYWPAFLVVLLDFAAGMTVLSILAARKWKPEWRAPAKFLAGVLLFLVGGTIQAFGLAPHPVFNHNDLFHVVQILGNWMFYLCAKEA